MINVFIISTLQPEVMYKNSKKSHHTGPILEEYIPDRVAGQKSLSKRLDTFKNRYI